MTFGYYPIAWELAIECELRASERLVLLRICDRANEEGVCWPSVRDLCESTGLTDRTVRRVLQRLEGGAPDDRSPLDTPLIKRTPRYRGDTQGRTSDLIHVLFSPRPVTKSGRLRSPRPDSPAVVTYEPVTESTNGTRRQVGVEEKSRLDHERAPR